MNAFLWMLDFVSLVICTVGGLFLLLLVCVIAASSVDLMRSTATRRASVLWKINQYRED